MMICREVSCKMGTCSKSDHTIRRVPERDGERCLAGMEGVCRQDTRFSLLDGKGASLLLGELGDGRLVRTGQRKDRQTCITLFPRVGYSQWSVGRSVHLPRWHGPFCSVHMSGPDYGWAVEVQTEHGYRGVAQPFDTGSRHD